MVDYFVILFNKQESIPVRMRTDRNSGRLGGGVCLPVAFTWEDTL